MMLEEVLYHAFLQNYHLDHSNAAIHCSMVRYSPLTFRLAEQIEALDGGGGIHEYVYEVLRDRGAYEEDKGR